MFIKRLRASGMGLGLWKKDRASVLLKCHPQRLQAKAQRASPLSSERQGSVLAFILPPTHGGTHASAARWVSTCSPFP